MKVSIITVCFNSADTIQYTLMSIASQTYSDIEHIIVDGGSTDGTLDVVCKLGGANTVLSSRDDGIYDAMNKGLNCATGDIVGFLNSDDIFANQNVVADIVDAIRGAPEVSGCYGNVEFVSRRKTRRKVRKWTAGRYSDRKMRWGWMPPHPTFYLKRSVYEAVGQFSLEYKAQSDYDMALRICYRSGVNLAYLDRTIVVMRMGGKSSESIMAVIRNNIEAVRIARRNGIRAGSLFFIIKIISRLPQFINFRASLF